jgi:hypothetical protein
VLGTIAVTKQAGGDVRLQEGGGAHYSDAAGRRAQVPKDPEGDTRRAHHCCCRKKLIADSRAACWLRTGETESGTRASLRGDVCFRGMGQLPASWGFPAVGVLQRTGIAECDSYSTTNAALLACKQFPQDARDAIRQGFEGQRQLWLNARADQKASYASACKQAEEAVRQAAGDGCAI